jgi:hypothetical protein
MEDKQDGHPSRPPSMFLHSSIKAPRPESIRRSPLGALRRFLTLEQLLQVDPLALSPRQERRTRPRTEVPNDDTEEHNNMSVNPTQVFERKVVYLMKSVKITTPPRRL